jgi:Glycosyltransferase family 87
MNLGNKLLPSVVVLYILGLIFTLATGFQYSPENLSSKLVLAAWIAGWSMIYAATWHFEMVRGRRSLWRNGIVLLLFVVSITIGTMTWVDLTLGGSLINTDFTQDYLAGYALRHDISIYGPSLKALSMRLFNFEAENYHPPFNALLFVPLSYLPYRQAFVVWSLFSLVSFGVLVVYSLRACGIDRYPWVPLSSMLLLWKPFTSSIWLGQLSVFLALLIVLGFGWLRREKENVAGLLFGFATLIKFFPALLLLYVVVERRWRCAAAWVATVALGLLLCLIVVGRDNWIYYIGQILPEQMRLFASFPFNLSIEGIARTIFGPTEYFTPARALPPGIVQAMVWIISGCFIVAACHLALRARPRASNADLFVLFCVTMLLASPLTWPHTCLMLVLALAMLLRDGGTHGQLGNLRVLIVVVALFSVPDPVVLTTLIEIYGANDVPWYVLVAAKTGSFALLTLWVTFWLRLRRENRQPAAATT